MVYVPPQRRITEPTCERCGGLRPEYARRNRRRLGSVMAGVVCCCKPTGCGDSVDLTLSGIDTSRCTGCYADTSSPTQYFTYDEISGVDGTYSVSFSQEVDVSCSDLGSTRVCEFLLTFFGGIVFKQTNHGNDDTCGGGDQNESNDLVLRVWIRKDDNTKVFQIEAEASPVSTGVYWFSVDTSDCDGTQASTGADIENQAVCGAGAADGHDGAANGGTAKVTLP